MQGEFRESFEYESRGINSSLLMNMDINHCERILSIAALKVFK
jgi:hypothetical protein